MRTPGTTRRRRRKLASTCSLRAGQQHARPRESGVIPRVALVPRLYRILARMGNYSASATTLTALNWKRKNVCVCPRRNAVSAIVTVFKNEYQDRVATPRWSAFVKAMAAGADPWRSGICSGPRKRSPRNRCLMLYAICAPQNCWTLVNGTVGSFFKNPVVAADIAINYRNDSPTRRITLRQTAQ